MAISIDLDKPESYEMLDKEGMMEKALALPDQIEETRERARDMTIAISHAGNILFLGMGGSGIGGNLIKSQISRELSIPFDVCQSYDIPASVNKNTLVVAVSYSGNTEETLAAFTAALARGGIPLCVTSGGELRKRAEALKAPCFIIPPGLPPRSALGYLYMAVFSLLEKTGLIRAREEEKDETLAVLRGLREEWKPEKPWGGNLAKACASRLKEKIPVIFGSSDQNAMVARRWKCQLNENAKMLAYSDLFPELNHNEVVGWSNPRTDYRPFHVIILRDAGDHPRIQRRIEITKAILQEKTTVEELWTCGTSAMAKLMSMVYLGDLVSVYCALQNGVNPTAIEVIDKIKEKLSEFREEARMQ